LVGRVQFARPFTGLLSGTETARVLDALLSSTRGLGIAADSIRIEDRAQRLADRWLEAYFPDRQTLVRFTVEGLEFQTSQSGVAARSHGTTLIEALAQGMGELLGFSNSCTTIWGGHVLPASSTPGPLEWFSRNAPSQLPDMGTLASTGVVLNFGPAPWDSSVIASSLVIEPSAIVEGAWYLSVKTAWARAEEPLAPRFHRYFDAWQARLQLKLEE
jgi:hypothetical protein